MPKVNKISYHVPPKNLEVDSDDSGEDDDNESQPKPTQNLTISKLKKWSTNIKTKSGFEKNFRHMIRSLQAALGSNDADKYLDKSQEMIYHVKDGLIFNAVIRACLMDVEPAIELYFEVSDNTKLNHWKNIVLSINFKKMKSQFYSYLYNIHKLASQLSLSSSLLAVLNHIKNLLPIYMVFPKLIKGLRNLTIKLWSSGEESVRVLAFLILVNIIKLSNQYKDTEIQNLNYTSLNNISKKMYRAYLNHCKFTTLTTLPLITFMQRTLIEIFELDLNFAYKYSFLNIKDMAIQLRNAYNSGQKENIQLVYNWQFVHSFHLWCQFISRHLTKEKSDKLLSTLVNPLVQIAMGTIKLVPSSRYIPIRFHLIKSLTLFCQNGTFIPILPFITEIFELVDLNKSQSVVLNKQINSDTLLKITKIQMREKAYKDEVVNRMYDSMIEYLVCYAHNVAFPEITFLLRSQLKKFLKTCRNPAYRSSFKQILTKIEENSAFMEKKRMIMEIPLTKIKDIEQYEGTIKAEGSPLSKYYATWKKIRTQEIVSDITARDRISEYGHIPRMGRTLGDDGETNEFKIKNSKGKSELTTESGKVKRRKPNELFEESSDSDHDSQLFEIHTKEMLSDFDDE